MNNNGQLDFLDMISVLSFVIAVMNLDENMTQSDKQELQHDLANRTEFLLKDIHKHLESQDIKLDRIMEELKNGTERDIQ